MLKYAGCVLIGFLLGYFCFSNSQSTTEKITKDINSTKKESTPRSNLTNTESSSSSVKNKLKNEVAQDHDFASNTVDSSLHDKTNTKDTLYKAPLKLPEIVRELFRENQETRDAKVLHQEILKDPVVYFARSKFTKDAELFKNKINGNYNGRFYRVGGKLKGIIEEVFLGVDINTKGDELDGSFQMTLTRDGNIYSNSRGQGGNGNIKVSPSDNRIIIKASPTTFFHFIDSKMRKAVVYEEGEYAGFAILEKEGL